MLLYFYIYFSWSLSLTAQLTINPLVARFMGPSWGPPGDNWTQVGPMLAPWALLSGPALAQVMTWCWGCARALSELMMTWVYWRTYASPTCYELNLVSKKHPIYWRTYASLRCNEFSLVFPNGSKHTGVGANILSATKITVRKFQMCW